MKTHRRLFRQRPILVEAVQWFTFGDHDRVIPNEKGEPTFFEDNLYWPVQFGDWIVHELGNTCYLCSAKEFEKKFQPVEESYGSQKVIFESFIPLEEAQEYRSAVGGYLLNGNDCYVVCDEERAIELLCLRGISLAEAQEKINRLQIGGFDETRL
jgi:hypothetical protein